MKLVWFKVGEEIPNRSKHVFFELGSPDFRTLNRVLYEVQDSVSDEDQVLMAADTLVLDIRALLDRMDHGVSLGTDDFNRALQKYVEIRSAQLAP